MRTTMVMLALLGLAACEPLPPGFGHWTQADVDATNAKTEASLTEYHRRWPRTGPLPAPSDEERLQTRLRWIDQDLGTISRQLDDD